MELLSLYVGAGGGGGEEPSSACGSGTSARDGDRDGLAGEAHKWHVHVAHLMICPRSAGQHLALGALQCTGLLQSSPMQDEALAFCVLSQCQKLVPFCWWVNEVCFNVL